LTKLEINPPAGKYILTCLW